MSQNEPKKISSPINTDIKQKIEEQFAKLMTSCTIIRVNDFTVHKVTTSGKKQPFKEFICGEF